MLIHDSTKNIFQTLFSDIEQSKKVRFPFWLIYGSKSVGKTTAILEFIKNFLGNNLKNDFLHIKDFSEELGKQHIIKIEHSDSESSDELQKTFQYQDIGAREICHRLDISCAGNYKIVLIENIERMNLSAINAMLKKLEEPMENNLIIATSSNKSGILETILSRAILIPFESFDNQILKKRLSDKYSGVDSNVLESLIQISMGRPGIAVKIFEKLQSKSEEETESLIDSYNKFLLYYKQKSFIDIFKLLSKISKTSQISNFLDTILYGLSSLNIYKNIDDIVSAKKKIFANVSTETVLLDLSYKICI